MLLRTYFSLFQVKLGDHTDDLPDSVGLLAFSSQGGYIFAGVKDTLHIIKSTDVEAQVSGFYFGY